MANNKDFGTASRGLLGLDKVNNQPKKGASVKTSVEFSEENMQFIEDIRTIEGGSLRTVLNGLIDDVRINKRETLNKAMKMHSQGQKTWKDL